MSIGTLKNSNNNSSGKSQRTFQKGDVIMKQGEKGRSAYLIEDGRVEITITSPEGHVQRIGTRGSGTIVGEMALIDNAPRTATVTAMDDCRLLEITEQDFAKRLDHSDPVLKMAIQVILARYRDMITRSRISERNINWPPAEALELNYAEETEAFEKIKIANDFKNALEQQELQLFYQPIVDLQNEKIVGFESLMRWRDENNNFIPPNVFIPVAEQSGLIVDASRWAFQEACNALKRLEANIGQDDPLFISVNFSSADFGTVDFVGNIQEMIQKGGIHPKQVHLEITERLLMEHPANAKDALALCRKNGMNISIDDFGTGYSSLSYLHYFPINTLKIDRSFVNEMNKDSASMELIRSIIMLGQNMKMDIIAEGVEHAHEAETLLELGCNYVQGYYFARPMPEDDVAEFTQKFNS